MNQQALPNGGPSPAVRAPDPRFKGSVLGRAYQIQQRYDPSARRSTLSFRIQTYDASGIAHSQPVAVELRGRAITGEIAKGDWVEAVGSNRQGTYIAKQVLNHTTGATVGATGTPLLERTINLVVVAAFIAIFLGVAFVISMALGS